MTTPRSGATIRIPAGPPAGPSLVAPPPGPPSPSGRGGPLKSAWEFSVAAHESGHLIVGRELRFTIGAVVVFAYGTACGGIRGSAEIGEPMEPVELDEHVRRRARVLLAGGIAKTLAAGIEPQPLRLEAAIYEAAEYRYETASEPINPTSAVPVVDPSSWPTQEPSDAIAMRDWVDNGRGCDLDRAVRCLRFATESIADPAERLCQEHCEWDQAWNWTLAICRRRLPDILALATLLCDRGGRLSATEVEAFFHERDMT